MARNPGDLFNSGGSDLFTSGQGTDLFSSTSTSQKKKAELDTNALKKALNVAQQKITKELNQGVKTPEEMAVEAAAKLRQPEPESGIDLVNLAKRALATSADIIGGTVNIAPETANFMAYANAGEQDIAMYDSIRQAQAANQPLTPEQEAFINAPEEDLYDPAGGYRGKRKSAYQRLTDAQLRGEFADKVDNLAASVRENLNINTSGTDEAAAAITDNIKTALQKYDDNDVMGSVGEVAGALKELAVDHPAAAVEFTVESLPYMITMVKTGILGIAGYSTNAYRDALDEFVKEHDRKPNQDERNVAALLAMSSAALDRVGAGAALGVKNTVKATMTAASKAGLKVPTAAGNKVLSAAEKATRPVRALVTEGFTEGSQSVLEQLAGVQDLSKVNMVEALTEGVIGSIAGGTTNIAVATPRTVIQGAAKTTELGRKVKDKVTRSVTENSIRKAAAKGDPDELINQIQDSDFLNLDPEVRQQQLDALGSAVDAGVAEVSKIRNKAEQNKEITKLERANDVLIAMQAAHDADLDTRSGVDAKTDIESLQSADETVDVEQTIDRVMGSRSGDGLLTEAKLDALLKNPEVQARARQDQLQELQARFEHAQLKNSNEVGNDIIRGSADGDFKGVKTYTTLVNQAIHNNDQQKARNELAGLKKFADSQRVKLVKLMNAWNEITDDFGRPFPDVEVVVEGFSKTTPRFTVSSASKNFIKKIKNEAQVLEQEYRILSRKVADVWGDPSIEEEAKDFKTINSELDAIISALDETSQPETQTAQEVERTAEPATQAAEAQPRETSEPTPTEREVVSEPEPVADTDQPTQQNLTQQDPRNQSGFLDPQEQANRDWQNRAQQQGLTSEQTEALAPEVPLDDVTGYFPGSTRSSAIKRGWDYVSQFGTIGSYVDIDLRNLGGLNSVFSHRGANIVYRAFADIIHKHTKHLGQMSHHRHGGDEMSIIAPTVSPEDMKLALDAAAAEIQQYVEANNLQDIAHPKYTGYDASVQKQAAGTGIYYGIALLDPAYTNSKNPVGDQAGAAEMRTEASKPSKLIALAEKEAKGQNDAQTETRPDPLTAEETTAVLANQQAGREGGQEAPTDTTGSQEAATEPEVTTLPERIIDPSLPEAAQITNALYNQYRNKPIETVVKKIKQLEKKIDQLSKSVSIDDNQGLNKLSLMSGDIQALEGIIRQRDPENAILNRPNPSREQELQVEYYTEVQNSYDATTPEEIAQSKAAIAKAKANLDAYYAATETVTEATVEAEPAVEAQPATSEAKAETKAPKENLLTKLKNLDPKTLPKDIKALRKKTIDTMERINARRANEPGYKPAKSVIDGLKRATATILKYASDVVVNTAHLGSRILSRNLVDPKNNSSLTTYYSSKGGSPAALIHKVQNVLHDLSNEAVVEALADVEPEAKAALRDVIKFARKFEALIMGNDPLLTRLVKKPHPGGKDTKSDMEQDPSSMLIQIDENGKPFIDSNVLATMAITAYNWTAVSGGRTLFNGPADINSILGRPKNEQVLPDEFNALVNAGNVRNVVADQLGAEVFNYLGLKAKDTTPGNVTANVHNGLGQMMITAMQEMGLIEVTKVKLGDFIDARSDLEIATSKDKSLDTAFIRVKTTPEGEPIDAVKNIATNMKTARPAVDKFVTTESRRQGPTTTPVRKAPKFLRGTRIPTPKALQNVIERMNAQPWRVKQNAANVFNNWSEESLKKLYGYVDDIESVHITQRATVRGKNLQIENDIRNMRELLEDTDWDADLFFNYTAWRNMRIGDNSNTVSPQASKMHRHLIGAKAWNVNIDPTTPEGREQLLDLYIGIAGALGKTKVDNASAADLATKNIQDIVNDPLIRAGMDAVSSWNQGDVLTAAQQQAYENVISDIVNHDTYGAEGEPMLVIDALNALNDMGDGTQPFTTNFAVESDGKTNGVIIGQMQAMGNGSEDILAAGNVFGAGVNPDTPREDNYERLASLWAQKLKMLFTTEDAKGNLVFHNEIAQGVEGIISGVELKNKVIEIARKLTKQPVMITSYGAAIERVVQEFTQYVLDETYNEIMKNQNDPAALQRIEDNINRVLGTGVKSNVFEQKLARGDKLAEFRFKDEAAFKAEVAETYGKALEEALEQEFGEFETYRDSINQALLGVFEVFNLRYGKRIAAEEKSLGRELSNDERLAIADELLDDQPLVQGPMSDGFRDGILAMREISKTLYDEDHTVQQLYTRKHEVGGKLVQSATGHSRQKQFRDAGVGPLVMLVHSLDSAINSEVLQRYDMLNIFDAGMYNVKDVRNATRDANQAFYEINKNYSLIDAVMDTYSRIYSSISEPEMNELNKIMWKKDYDKLGFAPQYPRTMQGIRQTLEEQQEVSNQRRALFFAEPAVILQYGWPGSDYYAEGSQTEAQQEADLEAAIQSAIQHLKSTPDADIDADSYSQITGIPLTPASSMQIFRALKHKGNVQESAAHESYLTNLMDTIVKGALTEISNLIVKTKDDGNENIGLLKENTIFVQNGIGVPPVEAMSSQEVFAHETVHGITRYALDNNPGIRRQVKKLWAEAKKTITWRDFLPTDTAGNVIYTTDPAADERMAKARYEYIFGAGSETNGQNNYLHEFVAYGMTNEKFRSKLSDVDANPRKTLTSGSIYQRIADLFVNILNWVTDKLHHTENMKADEALTTLVQEMTNIHEKNRNLLLQALDIPQKGNEAVLRGINKFVFQPLTDWRNRHANSRNKAVRAGRTIIGTPSLIGSKEGHKVIKKVSRNLGITEKNFAVQLSRELIGATENNYKYHQLLRMSKKWIDQMRQHISDAVTSEISKAFAEPLSRMESAAVMKTVLMTDLVSLADNNWTIPEMIDVIENQGSLDRAIAQVEAGMVQAYGQDANFYINQARGLGSWMAQGTTPASGQRLNAWKIATMVDTGRAPPSDSEQRSQEIDVLASLYALDRTTMDMRSRAARIMRREDARGADNGIKHYIDLHRLNKEEALERNFSNNKMLMVKGWHAETFDQAMSIQVVDSEEVADMIADGYTDMGPLPKDPKDPTPGTRHLMHSRDRLQMPYEKAITSLTAQKVKGHTLADAYQRSDSESPQIDAVLALEEVKAREAADIEAQFQNPNVTRRDPSSKLIPIGNERGETVGYRYTMTEHSKEKLLGKDLRAEKTMGKMFGSVRDKNNTQVINRKLVELAKEDWDNRTNTVKGDYVELSQNTSDPDMQEIFQLLPKEMKRDIKAVWGRQPMMIRADMARIMFGGRKMSITDFPIPGFMRALFTAFVPGSKYTHVAKTFEGIWQEGVRIAKDNIVIKNGVTLAGNIFSNNVLLYVRGVPADRIFKDQAEALRSINEFMGDVKKRDEMQRKLSADSSLSRTQQADLQNEISVLNEDIASNPVKYLIDEGIFQTIAEDVELLDDNPYSVRDQLTQKLGAVGDKLPKVITDAYKVGYMTHDQAPYQLLLRGTQYSDFIARYTYFNHLIEKGVPKEQALQEVIDTFINYDIPTSRAMQYANDMGLFMFTKFLFRIQRIILKSFAEKPATSLQVMYAQDILGDMPDINDSFLLTSDIFGRFNSPGELIDSATYAAGIDHATNIAGIDNPLE